MNVVNSKTFRSGNSEAVRLPKEVAFGANIDVVIERKGDVVTIRPKADPIEAKRKIAEMLETLKAIPRVGEIQDRESVRIEFPNPSGLD
ncbi:MAG: AbrB/MazE/SpoVT family DNA-binding domain-containing protein [Pseudomonadota bacterium]